MRKVWVFITLLVMAAGCNTNQAPDVSNIPVNIELRRFENFVFEKLDTNNLPVGISSMQADFPYFAKDFITNILGLPDVGSPAAGSDTVVTYSEIKRFIRLVKPMYDSLSPMFSETNQLKKELNQAFKYVRYYFPEYRIPEVVTYVGPFDAPGIAITNEALAIGLHLYAGRNFSFYTSAQGQELYPMYISRRFEPQYIPVNCMKAVSEDLFPDKSAGQSLIAQMVEKGKQWYLLDLFMPETPDTLKTAFTQEQLNWCEKNEGLIWSSILQNNDIYTTEPAFIKTYIGEGPNTQGMPESSPGNIGQWVGWQIVKAYANKNKEIKPGELMKTDPGKIFIESKYKPR